MSLETSYVVRPMLNTDFFQIVRGGGKKVPVFVRCLFDFPTFFNSKHCIVSQITRWWHFLQCDIPRVLIRLKLHTSTRFFYLKKTKNRVFLFFLQLSISQRDPDPEKMIYCTRGSYKQLSLSKHLDLSPMLMLCYPKYRMLSWFFTNFGTTSQHNKGQANSKQTCFNALWFMNWIKRSIFVDLIWSYIHIWRQNTWF